MQSQRLWRVVGRVRLEHQVGSVCALLTLLTGCATFDQRAGFSDVSTTVEARSGKRVVWNLGTELDTQVTQEVRVLLQDTLTADGAIQVALLNNRDLQALYAELGVAQADVVQAGLLKNPVFDGSVRVLISGGPLKLGLDTAMDFLEIFYLPLRKRVAAARFEDAKLQVTGAVLDFASTVRAAFYRHQANEQMLELLQTIVQSLTVSLEVAQRLHAAGNITDLDLVRERALAEEAKLQLRSAETAVRQSRGQLNTLMGLWGPQTAWHIDRRLPDILDQSLPIAELESRALRQSIDLASARQRIIVAGEQLGANRATALVPESSLGGGGEREEGGWEVGPVFEIPIPLFDQGQARIGRAMAELRQAKQEYYALGVRIRSTVRVVQEQVQGAQDRALYYRDILVPLLERIVNETQLQYNAMQLGVFDLLRPREQQIQTAVTYVETLRDYWLARPNTLEMTDFNILTMNGKVFPSTGPLVCKTGDKVRIRLGNLSAMDHHPIHIHGHHFRITATDGEDIPLSAQWPETTVLVAVGQTRTIEFIADAPGDWAFHCHMTHHVMNQMGHDFPNMVGVQVGGLDEKVRPLLPSYMTMGHTGMDMGRMAEVMPMPANSIPMKGAVGPFGDYISMGGMFTIVKVRDHVQSYEQDPGWYQHPPGTVALKASAAELARDGIDVNVPTARVVANAPSTPAHRAGAH